MAAIVEEVSELELTTWADLPPATAGYLHGWLIAVRRLGRGVLVLTGEKMFVESTLLLRSILEHSLAIRWLAEDTTAWRVVENAQRYELEKLERFLADNARPPWADLTHARQQLGRPVSKLDEVRDKRDHALASFKHLCQHFDMAGLGGDYFATWANASHAGHAGWMSAMTFVEPSGEGHMRSQPPEPFCEAFAADAVLDTHETINSVLKREPWTNALAALRIRQTSIVGPAL